MDLERIDLLIGLFLQKSKQENIKISTSQAPPALIQIFKNESQGNFLISFLHFNWRNCFSEHLPAYLHKSVIFQKKICFDKKTCISLPTFLHHKLYRGHQISVLSFKNLFFVVYHSLGKLSYTTPTFFSNRR